MKLKWLWRICPCRRCHGFRINRAYVEVLLQDMRETNRLVTIHSSPLIDGRAPEPKINMPKLLAWILEAGFDIRKPDEFAERKNYAWDHYEDPYGGTGP